MPVARIAARITLVPDDEADAALAAATVLFEGVPETLEAKREALARVCAAAPADAIVASTTSTILVTDLVPFVTQPERLINAHWLNPAYIIPLVELSAHAGTVGRGAPAPERAAARHRQAARWNAARRRATSCRGCRR